MAHGTVVGNGDDLVHVVAEGGKLTGDELTVLIGNDALGELTADYD